MASSQDNPRNSIIIKENLFVDDSEMLTGTWVSFYRWISKYYGNDAARKLLPDSSCIVPPSLWQYTTDGGINLYLHGQPAGQFDYGKPAIRELKKKCGYRFEGFVLRGISFSQANAFARWRTLEADQTNRFLYRLPSENEWKEIAAKTLSESSFDHGFPDSLLECQSFLHKTSCQKTEKTGKIKALASAVKPYKLLVPHLFGSQSEMTSTEGIAKGGNYLLYANQCHVDSVQYYTKPEKWLGFRTVSEPVAQSKINRDSLIREHVRFFFDDRHDFFVDARDGNFYRTVKIGNQTWMAQNLAYQPAEGKWWSLEKKIDYTKTLGTLYNPEAALNACPKGWRLPSKEDFEELVNQFGGMDKACSELVVNGKSGFAAFPVAFKSGINFIPTEYFAHFWALDKTAKKQMTTLGMDVDEKTIKFNPQSKDSDGISIRCIKE